MPRVLRSRRSRQDALDAWLHVAAHDPGAADRLLDAIDDMLHTLAESPRMGRARPELAANVRSFGVGSYLLFYRPRSGGIELLRILHGSRNLRRALKR